MQSNSCPIWSTYHLPQVKRKFFVDKFTFLSQKHWKKLPYSLFFWYRDHHLFNSVPRENITGLESTIAFEKLVKYTEVPTDPQNWDKTWSCRSYWCQTLTLISAEEPWHHQSLSSTTHPTGQPAPADPAPVRIKLLWNLEVAATAVKFGAGSSFMLLLWVGMLRSWVPGLGLIYVAKPVHKMHFLKLNFIFSQADKFPSPKDCRDMNHLILYFNLQPIPEESQ